MTKQSIINDSLINSLYNEVFGESPINIEHIIGLGEVNQVYKVTLCNETNIIRLREEPKAYSDYIKEKFCMEQAEKAGIPVAKVTCVDKYNDIPFIVQSYIDGINGSLCPDKSELIWATLGKYARLLQSAEVTGYGLDMVDYGVFYNSFSPSFKNHVEYNVNCICENDEFIKLGVYPSEQADSIKKAFSTLLNTDFPLKLIHGDMSLKNTIVSGDKVFLIDFGSAHVGIVPHDVFISLDIDATTKKEFSIFYKAYGISNEEFIQIQQQFKIFHMLNAFDKLRWAVDHRINDMFYYVTRAKEKFMNFKTCLLLP